MFSYCLRDRIADLSFRLNSSMPRYSGDEVLVTKSKLLLYRLLGPRLPLSSGLTFLITPKDVLIPLLNAKLLFI